MLNILWMICCFLIALTILVAVHEFGHFWVARTLGVKVLRYAIGFGKILFSWHDKQQTQYVIAAIPLGGYVKMLDEREGQVAEAELPHAFNRKPLWVRISVVLAGPLFNLLFAVVAYWLVFCLGINQIVPVIGAVQPHSIAAQANLTPQQEIVAVAGETTTSWTAVRLKILAALGSNKPLSLVTKTPHRQEFHTHYLDLQNWRITNDTMSVLGSLGIVPDYPQVPTIVGKVLSDTPAASTNLQVGDKILAFNDQAVSSWDTLVTLITSHPKQIVKLTTQREETIKTIPVLLDGRQVGNDMIGYLGIQPAAGVWPDYLLREQRYSPLAAIWPAITNTWDLFIMSWQMLGKMMIGKLSLKTISGPLGIAEGAGYSASLGFSYFLSFLALMSISLAMVNLLPIPLLDGGHLLYYLLEIVVRKPISERLQLLGMRIGLIFLLVVMLLAFYNDLSRW